MPQNANSSPELGELCEVFLLQVIWNQWGGDIENILARSVTGQMCEERAIVQCGH